METRPSRNQVRNVLVELMTGPRIVKAIAHRRFFLQVSCRGKDDRAANKELLEAILEHPDLQQGWAPTVATAAAALHDVDKHFQFKIGGNMTITKSNEHYRADACFLVDAWRKHLRNKDLAQKRTNKAPEAAGQMPALPPAVPAQPPAVPALLPAAPALMPAAPALLPALLDLPEEAAGEAVAGKEFEDEVDIFDGIFGKAADEKEGPEMQDCDGETLKIGRSSSHDDTSDSQNTSSSNASDVEVVSIQADDDDVHSKALEEELDNKMSHGLPALTLLNSGERPAWEADVVQAATHVEGIETATHEADVSDAEQTVDKSSKIGVEQTVDKTSKPTATEPEKPGK